MILNHTSNIKQKYDRHHSVYKSNCFGNKAYNYKRVLHQRVEPDSLFWRNVVLVTQYTISERAFYIDDSLFRWYMIISKERIHVCKKVFSFEMICDALIFFVGLNREVWFDITPRCSKFKKMNQIDLNHKIHKAISWSNLALRLSIRQIIFKHFQFKYKTLKQWDFNTC